jgi:hypothetical protein
VARCSAARRARTSDASVAANLVGSEQGRNHGVGRARISPCVRALCRAGGRVSMAASSCSRAAVELNRLLGARRLKRARCACVECDVDIHRIVVPAQERRQLQATSALARERIRHRLRRRRLLHCRVQPAGREAATVGGVGVAAALAPNGATARPAAAAAPPTTWRPRAAA